MHKGYFRKGLAVGIIVLFIFVSFAPSIGANINNKPSNKIFNLIKDKSVEVQITEYKSDGTRVTSVVELTLDEYKIMRDELDDIDNLEDRLSVWKKYDLIPQEISSEKLHKGMEELAEKIGFTEDSLNLQGNTEKYDTRLMYNNYFCTLNSLFSVGIHLFLGTSRLFWWYNFYKFWKNEYDFKEGIDLMDITINAIGNVRIEEGLLPGWEFIGTPFASIMIGFVGYSLGYPPIPFIHLLAAEYGGFAVSFTAIGNLNDAYPENNY